MHLPLVEQRSQSMPSCFFVLKPIAAAVNCSPFCFVPSCSCGSWYSMCHAENHQTLRNGGGEGRRLGRSAQSETWPVALRVECLIQYLRDDALKGFFVEIAFAFGRSNQPWL